LNVGQQKPADSILAAAFEYAKGNTRAAAGCAAELTSERSHYRAKELETAAESAGRTALDRIFRYGWLPADLYQAARRQLDEFGMSYLIDSFAAYLETFAPATVHPTWREQLDQLDATTWWPTGEPHFGQWAAKHLLIPDEALTTVVEVLGFLMTLHPLELIVPLPGTAQQQRGSHHHRVDQKLLFRVRALLAKAESSSFPEEAEALSAKAQQLMTRHALDRVLVDADTTAVSAVTTRRLWLDTPYVDAKSLLVQVVAKANRCRAIFHPKWGFVSVLGDESDLEPVELLTTSLLMQATRAMIASGGEASRSDQSRSRSYRKSFLVAYASRIGERLAAAAETTLSQVRDPGRLLPVLASQQRQVDAAFEAMFPAAVGKRVSANNHAGWGAGQAAADRALLEARRAVRD
jgi:hypothetical protein